MVNKTVEICENCRFYKDGINYCTKNNCPVLWGHSCDNFQRKENPRYHWHVLLDEAIDNTKEGESFLGKFVNAVIDTLKKNE